jgi:hypothetical protein
MSCSSKFSSQRERRQRLRLSTREDRTSVRSWASNLLPSKLNGYLLAFCRPNVFLH